MMSNGEYRVESEYSISDEDLCTGFLAALKWNGEFNDYVKAKAEENLSELGKKKEELKQQIDGIMAKDDILTQSLDLAEKWRKAGFQTRKTVLDALVDSILIHKDGQPEIIWKI